MAPRQKARYDYDVSKFIGVQAYTKYSSIFKTRGCIPDRIFEKPGGDVERIINERGWQNFCYNTNRGAIEVVKEFYSNFTQTDDNNIQVRGMAVEFSADRINLFYEIPDPYDCQYQSFNTMEDPVDEVINFLTDGKGKWKIKQRVRINFSASTMNAISKAWHYFICSTILPTLHHSEISRDRAILNFCIQKNLRINVGRIIYRNIVTTVRGETSGSLGHPGLIYALCQLSGVEAQADEEWIQPQKPISKSNIKTYESHEEWRSGQRGKEPSTSRDIPSTSYDPPAPSSPTLADLMNEITLTRKSVEILGEKIDHDSEYLYRRTQFEKEYYATQARHRSGELDLTWPEFPEYTRYQSNPPPDQGDDINWDFDFGPAL